MQLSPAVQSLKSTQVTPVGPDDVCWVAGTTPTGGGCVDFTDCMAGDNCVNTPTPLCLRMCDTGSPVCPGATPTCTMVTAAYGVCL